jgi:hypothetical protein
MESALAVQPALAAGTPRWRGTGRSRQGIGNLVHAAAMLAEDANADREQLVEYVSARFEAIELAARWLAGPERERVAGHGGQAVALAGR